MVFEQKHILIGIPCKVKIILLCGAIATFEGYKGEFREFIQEMQKISTGRFVG